MPMNIRRTVFAENAMADDEKKTGKIKLIAVTIAVTIFLSWQIYFLINLFAYFDPVNLCYVNINSSASSGEEISRAGLLFLKNNDMASYGFVCQNIEVINEGLCRLTHTRTERGKYDGCYIKGSKIVYITPSGIYPDDQRGAIGVADSLKVLAGYSHDFWQGKK